MADAVAWLGAITGCVGCVGVVASFAYQVHTNRQARAARLDVWLTPEVDEGLGEENLTGLTAVVYNDSARPISLGWYGIARARSAVETTVPIDLRIEPGANGGFDLDLDEVRSVDPEGSGVEVVALLADGSEFRSMPFSWRRWRETS